MTTELPRYVFARDARHWRAYDNKNLVFVASAPFRKSKAEARADAKALNDAAAEAERIYRNRDRSGETPFDV